MGLSNSKEVMVNPYDERRKRRSLEGRIKRVNEYLCFMQNNATHFTGVDAEYKARTMLIEMGERVPGFLECECYGDALSNPLLKESIDSYGLECVVNHLKKLISILKETP